MSSGGKDGRVETCESFQKKYNLYVLQSWLINQLLLLKANYLVLLQAGANRKLNFFLSYKVLSM